MTEVQIKVIQLARKRYYESFPEQCWVTFPLETAIAAMQASNDFDVDKYRLENPDIDSLGVDPITHWMKYGLNEGRSLKRKDADLIEDNHSQSQPEAVLADGAEKLPEDVAQAYNAGSTSSGSTAAPASTLLLRDNEGLNVEIAQAARQKFSAKLGAIPGMMTGQDCAIYVYYAGKYNHAEMIDAGCFIGCTTQCILDGGFSDGIARAPLKVFDRFIADAATKDWLKRRCGEEAGRLENFRPLFEKNMGGDLDKLEIHEGDLVESDYRQIRPLSFLGLDICESPQVTDAAMRKFFPALIPGNSILIHQDYIHPWLPHIHISMELLRDYFRPVLEGFQANTYVFSLEKQITEAVLDQVFGAAPAPGAMPEWYTQSGRNIPLMDEAIARMLYKNSKIQLGLAKAVYMREMGKKQEAADWYRQIKSEFGDLGNTVGCERMFMELDKTLPAQAAYSASRQDMETSPAQAIWNDNIVSETLYWKPIIRGTYANRECCEFMRKFSSPMECAPAALRQYLAKANSILDVGAGPVSVLGSHLDGKPLNIIAIDPLAHEYEAEFEKAGYHPLIKTRYGTGEELDKYVTGPFEVVFSRNALDHGYDPARAISNMLDVCAPGGIVRLENVINEGEHENYVGLHQFNFMPEGNELIIWNRNGYRKKLSEELAGRYDTFLVTKGPDRWVYVEIEK